MTATMAVRVEVYTPALKQHPVFRRSIFLHNALPLGRVDGGHVHMIVPVGGLSPSGNCWVACKPGFFLHVRVLSRLFRRLFIEGLLVCIAQAN